MVVIGRKGDTVPAADEPLATSPDDAARARERLYRADWDEAAEHVGDDAFTEAADHLARYFHPEPAADHRADQTGDPDQ